MNKKKLIAFVIIIMAIIGVFYYSIYSMVTVSKPFNYKVGDCYKGNTITKITPSGTRLSLTTTKGCDCELIYTKDKTRPIDISVAIFSDNNKKFTRTRANIEAVFINEVLKINNAFKNYNFDYYYEKYDDACRSKIPKCSYFLEVGIMYNQPNLVGLCVAKDLVFINYNYRFGKSEVVHEFGHAIGNLPDLSRSSLYYGETNSSVMYYYSGNLSFQGWEKAQINSKLMSYKSACK